MAITRIATTSNSSDSSDSLVVTLPTRAADDLLLLYVGSSDSAAIPTPSGWTSLGSVSAHTSSPYARVAAFALVVDNAVTPAVVTISGSTSVARAGVCVCYRGAAVVSYGAATASDAGSDATRSSLTSGDPSGSHIAGQVAVVAYYASHGGFGVATITQPDTALYNVNQNFTSMAVGEKTTNTRNASTATLNIPDYAAGFIVVLAERYSEAPAAVLVSPANAAPVDLDDDTTFVGEMSDVDDDDYSTAYRFRIKEAAGAYTYWNAGTATFGAITDNVTTDTSVEIPGGTRDNDTTHHWSFEFRDRYGNWSGFATDRTIVGTAPAVVTVTDPAGTIVDSSRPPIEWTYVDPESDPIDRWHAKVFTADAVAGMGFDPETSEAAWDSGETVGSALTVTPDEDLPNLDNYFAHVKVETGGLWSNWDQGPAFDIDITPPTDPTIVATVDDTAAAVDIDVASLVIDDATNYVFHVQRSVEGGDWAYVRGASPTDQLADNEADPDEPQATVADREAPLGRSLLYRAKAIALVDGALVASGWVESDEVTLSNTRWWLKAPLDPSLDIPVSVVNWDPQQTATAGVFYPRGRSTAHVATGDTYGEEGTPTFRPMERADREALFAILESGETLLLQSILGEQWYVRRTGPRARRLVKTEPGWRRTPLRDVHEVTVPLVEVTAP